MDSVHSFFKVSLPQYLKTVRIPRTFSGIGKLTGTDWWNLMPLIMVVIIVIYATIKSVRGSRKKTPKPKVNYSIQKEESKVVNQMDIEDIGDNIAFCRCWRSKKFPICDGSHKQHNAEARDNVGPLLLRRRE